MAFVNYDRSVALPATDDDDTDKRFFGSIDDITFPPTTLVGEVVVDDVALRYDRRIRLDNSPSLTFASLDVILKLFNSKATSWKDVFAENMLPKVSDYPKYILSVLLSYYSLGVHVSLTYVPKGKVAINAENLALEKIYARLARGLVSTLDKDQLTEGELLDINKLLYRSPKQSERELHSLCATTLTQCLHKRTAGKR